jgi:malonate-semialdehyde dehydrogenase (acetylating)/methylmalonate-semialdehyde dehydrogenase
MVSAEMRIRNFVDGQWVSPAVSEYGPVYNPSTSEKIGETPFCSAADVEKAVEAAKRAFPGWAETPPTQRADLLFRYRQLLNEHFDELSDCVCRENGKTLEEAKGDVTRGMEVVAFACGIPHLLKGESLPQVADQIDAATVREPLGVCAGVTPFNFPAMVPMWMFPIAIACGNTYVLKPSEKVPLTANRLVELFHQAGLPQGVFNVVHGARDVVDSLCVHPDVKAISFVGSTAVAKHVYRLATQHGKRVQSAGGAKNVLLVMPDADPDSTMRAVMGSSFGCAGQRCMAGSLLMVVGEAADKFRDKLVAEMDTLCLDDTTRNPEAGMGAVIDDRSQQRLFKIIERADNEGIQILRDGRENIPDRGFFVGPTLFDQATTESFLFQEELFGPLLTMLRPSSLDEALEWLNQLPFGNGASIFTRSAAAGREFTRRIQCGMLGVNIGVPAPMALFPFSGWNESFFGDLHVQGTEGVSFFTRQKVILSRWDKDYVRSQGW